ncbi:MAG TPA: RNA polymerase sigma factor [Acidobacteriota bacterium]|nr:RNA polymerase sigma factor [Acidobacteriota bacterium]
MQPKKEKEFIRHFNRYKGQIYGYFSNEAFGPEDCDDLTQETFLAALKGYDGFRGEAEFRTWVFEIARNVLRHRIRAGKAQKRAGREVTLDEAELNSTRDSPGLWQNTDSQAGHRPAGRQLQDLLSQERLTRIREAMEELPDQMRLCMYFLVYQQRKYHEIAELMQISIGTVKSHIHGARKRLKEQLGDLFDFFER